VEINDQNAHKGNAIRQLAEHLGLDMSQVLAFGDGSNDITMLKEAGIGVCMENGLDSVKAVADYITDSCDEDGVAKAIYRFCK
jgi:Cof subfamily protein (haloacid dehalogenase superfamily)